MSLTIPLEELYSVPLAPSLSVPFSNFIGMSAYHKILFPRKFSKCKFIPIVLCLEKSDPSPFLCAPLSTRANTFSSIDTEENVWLKPGVAFRIVSLLSFPYSVFLFSVGLYTVFFFFHSRRAL